MVTAREPGPRARDSCAHSIPTLHRVQELNLEEKQWHLDQELRRYMKREGGWHVAGLAQAL